MHPKKLPVIVFISAVYPSQHSLLCKYLRENHLADSWFMTHQGHVLNHAGEVDHLLSFIPDGDIMDIKGYYYSSLVERSARISEGMIKALKAFENQKGVKIDLIVAHGVWASPNWLREEFDCAIISYIEFPSYKAHGWDKKYPPTPEQARLDVNLEMLSYQQVINSELTITPSHYAKSLFPSILHEKIYPQFEGFDIKPLDYKLRSYHFKVGFAARDLSSSKGFETFVQIVDHFKTHYPNEQVEFIAIGDPKAVTYGYEKQWVEKKYNDKSKTFCDHLRLQYLSACSIEITGGLSYQDYSSKINEVDLFLYPLKHGVANWGLMELLARGSCVIASDHGFCPELIGDGYNGFLVNQYDIKRWCEAIIQIKDDPQLQNKLRINAIKASQKHHISIAAKQYMKLFDLAIAKRLTNITL